VDIVLHPKSQGSHFCPREAVFLTPRWQEEQVSWATLRAKAFGSEECCSIQEVMVSHSVTSRPMTQSTASRRSNCGYYSSENILKKNLKDFQEIG
jgi:hypothetical protein